MVLGNLGFRLVGAAAALVALGPAATLLAGLDGDPGRLAAHFHTLFNLALALVFLPLVGRVAALLERAFPDGQAPRTPASTSSTPSSSTIRRSPSTPRPAPCCGSPTRSS